MYKVLTRIDQFVDKFIIFLVCLAMIFLLITSIAGIIFRWINSPILWIDPLVRHLVFLLAFLGGVLAAGRNAHISIDILGRYFEAFHNKKIKMRFNRLIYFISLVALFWLADSSFEFLKVEIEFGKISFLGIHSSILVGIIPLGFSLIAFRYFYKFIDSFSMFHGEEELI